MDFLASLAPEQQVDALNQFFRMDISGMKNPSAYLSGIIRDVSAKRHCSDSLTEEDYKSSRVSKHLETMYRTCGATSPCLPAQPAGRCSLRFGVR